MNLENYIVLMFFDLQIFLYREPDFVTEKIRKILDLGIKADKTLYKITSCVLRLFYYIVSDPL